MKKEQFEIIGMLQMAIKGLEMNQKGRNELEKNALEMIRHSVKILSDLVLEKLSVNENRQT